MRLRDRELPAMPITAAAWRLYDSAVAAWSTPRSSASLRPSAAKIERIIRSDAEAGAIEELRSVRAAAR